MVGGELREAGERHREPLARLPREDFGFLDATGREHLPWQEDATPAGMVTEGAEVPDEGVCDTQMARRVASLDRLAPIEDHRGELVERRYSFARIALEARD